MIDWAARRRERGQERALSAPITIQLRETLHMLCWSCWPSLRDSAVFGTVNSEWGFSSLPNDVRPLYNSATPNSAQSRDCFVLERWSSLGHVFFHNSQRGGVRYGMFCLGELECGRFFCSQGYNAGRECRNWILFIMMVGPILDMSDWARNTSVCNRF